MLPQFKRRTAMSIAAMAAALSISAGHAADLPPAGMNILDWPRMASPAFGCLMEKTLGHRDPRFNCSLKSVKMGDPCVDTENYYAGPIFPPALAARIHPLASDVSVDFEHGEVRTVSVRLQGKFSESDVLKAFDLAGDRKRPPNIMFVSVQDCSRDGTCLLLTGFDHLGAGDVDCSKQPRR
jgi:hypothetical protein